VYPLACGAGGVLKSGPTAQADTSMQAATAAARACEGIAFRTTFSLWPENDMVRPILVSDGMAGILFGGE
jgi:hypothetical protein